VLKDLSLWDKKDFQDRDAVRRHEAPGDIAKALSHEPQILFLDEPTAGVDVELRAPGHVGSGATLAGSGVTIILTTHYIEEAEEMADRNRRHQQGRDHPDRGQGGADAEARQEGAEAASARPRIEVIPDSLAGYNLEMSGDGPARSPINYDHKGERTGITACSAISATAGITSPTSIQPIVLEDIFVSLVSRAS